MQINVTFVNRRYGIYQKIWHSIANNIWRVNNMISTLFLVDILINFSIYHFLLQSISTWLIRILFSNPVRILCSSNLAVWFKAKGERSVSYYHSSVLSNSNINMYWFLSVGHKAAWFSNSADFFNFICLWFGTHGCWLLALPLNQYCF